MQELAKVPGVGKIIPDLGKVQGLDQILSAVTKIDDVLKQKGLNKVQGITDILGNLATIPGVM